MKKNTVQTTPISMLSNDMIMVQQLAYQNSECSICLPKCFQVYNMTRQFGKTVNAVEQGWIK